MRLRTIWAGVGCAAMMGCGGGGLSPTQETVSRDEIRELLTTWTRQVTNQDLDSILAMYHDDPGLVVAWSNGDRARGLAEYGPQIQAFVENAEFLNLDPQNPLVDVLAPNVALSSFRYTIDLRLTDGTRDPYAGQATLVWVRDAAGAWKIHNQIFSRNPA